MFCVSCGKEINDSANFCKYCGKQISNMNSDKSDPLHINSSDLMQSQYVSNIKSQVSDAISNNENAKKVLGSKDLSGSSTRMIFGVGSALILLSTFLPWAKTGLMSSNPYLLVKLLLESSAGGGIGVLIVGILIMITLAAVIVSNAYGAYMCFAKSRLLNACNLISVLGCVGFLLVIFLSQFILTVGLTGDGQSSFSVTFTLEIGFFIAILLSLILTVLGSGLVDINKFLNKGNS